MAWILHRNIWYRVMTDQQNATSMTVLSMPEWKHKILNAVAWLLGMRGEHVACITFNFDYTNLDEIKKYRDHACQDCTGKCNYCER